MTDRRLIEVAFPLKDGVVPNVALLISAVRMAYARSRP